eukprot:COSAG06_NODE_10917_length_1596_cov_1.868403_2_plen_225_part_00
MKLPVGNGGCGRPRADRTAVRCRGVVLARGGRGLWHAVARTAVPRDAVARRVRSAFGLAVRQVKLSDADIREAIARGRAVRWAAALDGHALPTSTENLPACSAHERPPTVTRVRRARWRKCSSSSRRLLLGARPGRVVQGEQPAPHATHGERSSAAEAHGDRHRRRPSQWPPRATHCVFVPVCRWLHGGELPDVFMAVPSLQFRARDPAAHRATGRDSESAKSL